MWGIVSGIHGEFIEDECGVDLKGWPFKLLFKVAFDHKLLFSSDKAVKVKQTKAN